MPQTQHVTFALPDYAGIRAAVELRATLLEVLSSHDEVEIQSDAVAEADVSTVQLLLSAQKFADLHGKTLRMAHPLSSALRDVVDAAGLREAPHSMSQSFWFQQGTPE